MRNFVTTAVLVVLVAMTGCLEKTVVQTLYLERDGSVTWEIVESDVYSSDDDPVKRQQEEAQYLDAARSGHPVAALALEQFGGQEIDYRLVREKRPYALRATARFTNVEAALKGFFEALKIDVHVSLTSKNGDHVLLLKGLDQDTEIDSEDDSAAASVLMDSEGLRFVLSEGKFVEAHGVAIEQDGRVAIFGAESEQDDGTVRLKWRDQ